MMGLKLIYITKRGIQQQDRMLQAQYGMLFTHPSYPNGKYD